MQVDVEILHPCGNWIRGERVRLEVKRAEKILRTGYARLIEAADAEPAEQATRPKAATRTLRGERRG